MGGDFHYIHTFTGRKFYPLAPTVDDIDIRDVAHSLALQARWNGHSRTFYSVAEHSVRVSLACAARDALWGLLHDAGEAYLKDLPKPLKDSEPFGTGYRAAEDSLMEVIAKRFGLDAKEPASVKRADSVLLHTEARDLFTAGTHEWADPNMAQPTTLKPLDWRAAEAWFLERFRALDRRRKAAEAAA